MWKTQDYHFNKTISTNGNGISCPVLETKCYIDVKEVTIHTKSDDHVNALKEDILQTSEFTVGWSVNHGMKLLGVLVMTMKKGETSCFDVSTSSSLSLNNETGDAKHEHIKCNVVLELTNFDDRPPIWKLSDAEKFELALSHKNEGSKLFQESRVEAAFDHYSLSTKYLILMNLDEDESEVDLNEYEKLRCVCYLNLAACQLRYKNYECVITNCCKALNIDGRNVKALYRRASAYIELGRKDDAKSDLLQAKKHEPKNKVIHQMLQSLTVADVSV